MNVKDLKSTMSGQVTNNSSEAIANGKKVAWLHFNFQPSDDARPYAKLHCLLRASLA